MAARRGDQPVLQGTKRLQPGSFAHPSGAGPRLGSALNNGRKLNEARDSAVTDYLTGLPNSRSLYLHLDEELARSRRLGSLGVLLCDLDGFKRVNDEYGHLAETRC